MYRLERASCIRLVDPERGTREGRWRKEGVMVTPLEKHVVVSDVRGDDVVVKDDRRTSRCLVREELILNIRQRNSRLHPLVVSIVDQTVVLVENCGKVTGWLDASDPGAANWMKLVHSTEDHRQQNLMAVQLDEQVFYKSVRDIHPGDDMLLYAREAVYPEMELEPFTRHNFAGEQTYSCPSCGEVFRSKVAVRRHQTYSCTSSISPYRSLNEQMGLTQHSLSSGNNVLSAASTANMQGGGSNDSSSHVSNSADSDGNKSDTSDCYQEPAESGNGGEYKCDECPKSFQWKANLQRHQLTHDADRKFPCENCDKVFTDPSNLQRHIRSQHVGARSHACTECGKTFATSSGLKQHQHIHSSIKPFQCEVCLKAYTQFSNLCRHKRMHADCRQQIKCKDCGQAFSTVTSLSKHKRFCEGVMRNGMRPIYPSEKLSPMSMPSNGQAPHLSPSLFPNIYAAAAAARPQFPFSPYPHFGSFAGLLPQGLPAMLGSSPVSPSTALKLAANIQNLSSERMFHLSPETGSISSKVSNFSSPFKRDEKLRIDPGSSAMSDADMSEDSDHSELDMSKLSDDEGESSKFLKRKQQEAQASPLSPQPGDESAAKVKRLEATPSPSHEKKQAKEICIAPPGFTQFRPQSPISSTTTASKSSSVLSSVSHKLDTPFDLSSRGINHEVTHSSPFSVSKTAASDKLEALVEKSPNQKDDVPLDLSKKPVKPIPILPLETPRKTHIYGEIAPSPTLSSSSLSSPSPAASSASQLTPVTSMSVPSDPKPSIISPFSYPFSPIMMESLLRIKEDMKLQQEAAVKFTHPFTRFPMPGPTAFPGLHPHQFSMLPRPEYDKVLSPMMKLEKPSEFPNHHHQHHPHHNHHPHHFGPGTPGKSKERYACKFCGKVFPRSANLTRHLRTHTGEQPYKCKYCERSFSISSNLQRHVRNIHNKEKPFKCQLCDRCFGQQTNLDRHLKKHEQEGPHVSDSPTAELDDKDDSYFSEIRNFIGNSGKIATADRDAVEEKRSCVMKETESVSEDIDVNVDNDLSVDDNTDDITENDGEDDEIHDDVDISDDEILDEEDTPASKTLIISGISQTKAESNSTKFNDMNRRDDMPDKATTSEPAADGQTCNEKS